MTPTVPFVPSRAALTRVTTAAIALPSAVIAVAVLCEFVWPRGYAPWIQVYDGPRTYSAHALLFYLVFALSTGALSAAVTAWTLRARSVREAASRLGRAALGGGVLNAQITVLAAGLEELTRPGASGTLTDLAAKGAVAEVGVAIGGVIAGAAFGLLYAPLALFTAHAQARRDGSGSLDLVLLADGAWLAWVGGLMSVAADSAWAVDLSRATAGVGVLLSVVALARIARWGAWLGRLYDGRDARLHLVPRRDEGASDASALVRSPSGARLAELFVRPEASPAAAPFRESEAPASLAVAPLEWRHARAVVVKRLALAVAALCAEGLFLYALTLVRS